MHENLTDLHLLHELEPVVEKLLNRHLTMRKDWNPHDYIPWSDGKNYYALGGQDWDPEQSKLSEVAQTAMVQNLLTEDNLPSYHREIAMNMSMDGAWGQWVNRWTAEENRHGIALRDYLVVTRAVDPVQLEELRVEQMTRGFSPGQNQQGELFAESLFDSVIYVTFQELATRVSHRNTGKACAEPVADQLLQRVSADENLHMIFYRDVSEAGFDIAPDQAMHSLHRVLRNFKMPGYTVPEFRRKAVIIAVGGVYDPPRRRGASGAQEVAHLRARGLHRRGRAHARRPRRAGHRARGGVREVRALQAEAARARSQDGREEGQ
jgi:acyl-[acyl-carrier-protein] desaturase